MGLSSYLTPWRVCLLAAGALAVGVGVFGFSHDPASRAEDNTHLVRAEEAAENGAENSTQFETRVETVKPKQGGIARTTSQPGSAHSFESALLFSKVSGYLQKQNVDIGSHVKHGQVLAEIYVPELTKELDYAKAMLEQAQAEVAQMQSRIQSAIADHKAAEAYITQTEDDVQRREAEKDFRDKQYNRMLELSKSNAIEDRLVDEKLDQLHAAESAERVARSTVRTAQQQAVADQARVDQARADLKMSQAKVRVAEASIEKAQVMVDYTKILSPYDGVVTLRSFYPGAYIRAPDQGGQVPLLCVNRTDLMRIIVQIPDREVPYTQPGDKATVRLDALPSQAFRAKISRIADSEDSETRAMRVEIDLPNSAGLIRDEMYGKVDIELEPAPAGVTIPSACLVGNAQAGKAQVFVVQDGKVHLKHLNVGKDTGVYVEVLSGLNAGDQVVLQPPSGLADGVAVVAIPAAEVASPAVH